MTVQAAASAGSPVVESSLFRSTASITAGNVVSRLTGFVRVLAVAAALGTTFLGNTYQTSNLVSNILFELLAAGLLSSVLVPMFVGLFDRGEDDEAEHVASALLGLSLAALGVVTLVGVLAGSWIMRLLTIAVRDPAVRANEVRLGAFFLWFFLPQVLLYAAGAVTTALLHGARRFTAPAFAPVANNVVVTATMVAFWVMSRGRATTLDLPIGQRLVLALGTTAGVVAMTLVPLVAAWRAGLRLRPRWDLRHVEVRRLARPGMWAALYLTLNQLLIATTLILANRVRGGVVAYQVAFTFFLLPHAIFANPVVTALYPRLASEGHEAHLTRFRTELARGTRLVAFLVLPASALLFVLARPILHLVQAGELEHSGLDLVARVLAAYALGLAGYALFQFLTRASYAVGDTRSPTLVNLGVTTGGSVLMLVLFAAASGDDRVAALGVAHSVAMVVGALALAAVVRRRVGGAVGAASDVTRSAVCAVGAGLLAWAVVAVVGSNGRLHAAASVTAGGVVAVGAYVVAQWFLRAPELSRDSR